MQIPHPMQTRAKSSIFKSKLYAVDLLTISSEPTTESQAYSDPIWKKAMIDEYIALLKNNTWHLVPYHSYMNILSTKWIFRNKYDLNEQF